MMILRIMMPPSCWDTHLLFCPTRQFPFELQRAAFTLSGNLSAAIPASATETVQFFSYVLILSRDLAPKFCSDEPVSKLLIGGPAGCGGHVASALSGTKAVGWRSEGQAQIEARDAYFARGRVPRLAI
ncbi:MAG TPA: hypothetical protein VKC66_38295 [Xanthobacteraceae bacterium]|nr:hypothetical protein [Xanthobacteraceae bacterium]